MGTKPEGADRGIPAWISLLLVGGTFAALAWLELRRPLRRNVEAKFRRNARNFAVGAISAAALQLTERPVTSRLSALVIRRRWGLLRRRQLPLWFECLAALLLLDYTLYGWHWLVHKIPFLWRFHQVHHVDLDLDASTALRFHFGELIFSVGWRAAQIVGFGVGPKALSLWNTLLLLEIMFHHSNARLPAALERQLSRIVITPRLHGIHHSSRQSEMDSNWSSGLTLWDYLHGTLRRDVPQDSIMIGTAAFRDPAEVVLPKILAMPFKPQPLTKTPNALSP